MNRDDYQRVVFRIAGDISGQKRDLLTPRLQQFFSHCDASNEIIYPDDRLIIEEICKNIDAEANDSHARSKIANVESVLEEINETGFGSVHEAISHSVGHSTIVYYDPNDLSSSIATGVLVQLGNHTLIATTSHSVPLRPQGRLEIASRIPTSLSTIRPNIVSSGRPDNSNAVDVAYLEIEPQFVSERLDKTPITVERIMPCGTGLDHHWTFVFGYPAVLIDKIRYSETSGTIRFNGQCWGFPSILTPSNWRYAQDDCRPKDQHVDAFVAYDRNSEFKRDGKVSDDQLAVPSGMSGGGWWQKKASLQDAVWHPGSFGLMAIQCSWPNEHRYLRGTQIHHWLRLIWNHFTDLREILRVEFPQIFS